MASFAYADPDAPAANAAAAGVAALNLGADDVDLSALPGAVPAHLELDLEIELELARLAEAAAPPKSPSLKPKKAANPTKPVDLASDDLFPTLGGPAPAAAAAPRSMFAGWASRPSIAAGKPTTVAARAAAATKAGPQEHSATVSLPISALLPALLPKDKTTPAALVQELKYVSSKSKTKINASKQGQLITFTVRGAAADLDLAKRMVVAAVTPKVRCFAGFVLLVVIHALTGLLPPKQTSTTILIPARLRGNVIGNAGKIIQGIQTRTQVRIDFARPTADIEDKVAAAKAATEIDVTSDETTEENENDDDDASESSEEEADLALEDASTEPMLEVKLTGDAKGLELAKAELSAIVGEHVALKRAKLPATLVPPAVYPFLLGPKGARVAELEAAYGVRIHVPPPSFAGSSSASADADKVVITGEADAVRAAAAAVREAAAEIASGTAALNVDIPKRQHKFVLGANGANLHELMDATGCIVELPAAADTSTTVTVRGPAANLARAFELVMAKAASVVAVDFDLAPYVAGGKSTATAAVLAKYLNARDRPAIKAIEAEAGAQIFFPRAGDAHQHVLEVAGPSKAATDAARALLTAHLTAKGTFFYNAVAVPSELLKHSRVRAAIKKAREELANAAGQGNKALTLDAAYLTDAEFADELTLAVFDPNHGPSSAKKGSTNSVAPTVKAKIAEDIVKAAHQAAEFATEIFTVPAKYHKHLVGVKGAKLNALIAEVAHTPEVPLVVRLGTGPKKATADKAPVALEADQILVRGIKAEVTAAIAKLRAVAEEAKHAEIMGGFTAEFTIPAKHAPHIVGKAAANLNKYKEVIGIEKIDVAQPAQGDAVAKVSLKGTQKAMAAVEAAIRARIVELDDATAQTVKVPNEFHGKIIGEKGKYVKRLEDKYAVRIQFPRQGDAADDQNAITVRGARKGVAGAVAEIVELYEYEKATSFTDTVTVPGTVIASLVGKGGSRIAQLKQLTDVRIDFPHPSGRRSATPDVDEAAAARPATETITLTGTKDQVVLTKQVIREVVSIMNASGLTWASEAVPVPKALHRRLIGPGGSALRAFLAPFNSAPADEKKKPAATSTASEEVKALARTIFGVGESRAAETAAGGVLRADLRVPKSGEDVVVRACDAATLAKVKAALLARVAELQDEVTLVVHLPVAVFPALIGRGGAGARELQDKFKVNVDFEKKTKASDEPIPVPEDRDDLTAAPLGAAYVRGSAAAARAAIDAILAKVPYTKSVSIPASHKRGLLFGSNPKIAAIRALGVTVDMPPKAQVKDDQDETWSLRAEARDKVAAALAELEAYLATPAPAAEASGAAATRGARPGKKGPEVVHTISDIEPRDHRHIIGRAGMTITEIRNATNTRIDVPRAGESGDKHTITIRGAKQADVDEAERMIREAVERANQ
ncbi:hypothetical protein H9P43_004400 [Blastocladiella emersonii ATCC 22665]|nr:hypothetical protein H9P43_004400 [Blastocladiella emersonii ATCC 22665]